MRLYTLKLLTIICELFVQNQVKDILKRHNITGYTSYEVEGVGDKGLRGSGRLPEEKNVKIEIILREERMSSIVEEISRTLFADCAIILHVSDVQVARIEKFV